MSHSSIYFRTILNNGAILAFLLSPTLNLTFELVIGLCTGFVAVLGGVVGGVVSLFRDSSSAGLTELRAAFSLLLLWDRTFEKASFCFLSPESASAAS